MRICLVLAIVIAARTAMAAPRGAAAKAAFTQGVTAYKAGDFVVASEALERSFKLEADPETLFAWAQSERKQSHCDKAIPLYERLLTFDMPAANKTAISTNLSECKAVIAAAKPPAAPPPVDEAKSASPVAVEQPRVDVEPKPVPTSTESKPWWKDPVGDGLVVVGLVGAGVGAGMLVSASSLNRQADGTTSYSDYQRLREDANSRSELGLISAGAGGVFVVGGILWYATHRDSRHQVVGWLDRAGGGLGVAGAW
jgi:hypothetical protein